jgi:hypothetical protein
VNLHLGKPHLQLQVMANPFVGPPKWIFSESEIVSLVKKITRTRTDNNFIDTCSLISLSVLYDGTITSALTDASYSITAASSVKMRSQSDEKSTKIQLDDYSSALQSVSMSMKLIYVQSLLDNVISAVMSLIDNGNVHPVAMDKVIGRSTWFLQAPVEDNLVDLLEANGGSSQLLDSLNARGESILENLHDRQECGKIDFTK